MGYQSVVLLVPAYSQELLCWILSRSLMDCHTGLPTICNGGVDVLLKNLAVAVVITRSNNVSGHDLRI